MALNTYTLYHIEPFDDEMKISEKRAINWLIHFGLITKKGQLSRSHVLEHGDGNQMRAVVKGPKTKKLIPIHTEKEQFRKKWPIGTCHFLGLIPIDMANNLARL
jgi:hypothetical protein